MDYSKMLAEIAVFVTKTYSETDTSRLHFHNLNHILEVLELSQSLCDHYQLEEADRFVVTAAAWFHDIGYLYGKSVGHEEYAADYAEKWLAEKDVPADTVEKIRGCIMATMLPQKPQTLNEQIICDADLWQLGTDRFTEKHKLLRREMAEIQGKVFDTDAWRKKNIDLLKQHQFHTDYARMLLQLKKEEHLNRLMRKSEMADKTPATTEKDEGKKKKQKGDKNDNLPTRGIETMFRVTMSNHMELSSMADAKANIMISINSIIASVVLSILVRYGTADEYAHLVIPLLIMIGVNLVTIVFSVLSVRPKLISGKFTEDDIRQKRANLLFFGNFHRVSLDTYEWGMHSVMQDRHYLYSSMIRNIYFLGVVLGRKYNLLRIAYNVFMYGFIIAVIAAMISYALHETAISG